MMKMKMKNKKKKKRSEIFRKGTNSSPLDTVPADLARVVVNMQQYYASGVGELADKLGNVEEELRRAKEENAMMKKRLDMHFGMLGQTAEFMQRISEGFAGESVRSIDVDGDGDGDGDLDMEVPPTPVDDRLPIMSTGRMASRKSPVRRSTAARVLPIRDKMAVSQDDGDAVEKGREEQRHDRGEEDARVLEGAPRLQEAIRQDIMQRAISRQLRFTPMNLVPSRQSTPSSGDDNSDSDEYHPPSLSSETSCSSSGSPPSLDEEGMALVTKPISPPKPRLPKRRLPAVASSSMGPSLSTTLVTRPPNPQLPTPPLTAASSTSTSTSTSSSSSTSSPRPKRYSTPRRTTQARYASGPPDKPFRFHRMGRSVLDVWTEYKIGYKGNPAIEALEEEYGTNWRTGETRDVKYASNYVSVRQKVVKHVEEMSEREGISKKEAIGRLDKRVDGRMHMLISAVRKGQDPFVVIPER